MTLEGAVFTPWNNGKEVPRWGVAEIHKMSPSTTGRCSRVIKQGSGDSRPMGARHGDTATNHSVVGRSVFAVQAWSNLLPIIP